MMSYQFNSLLHIELITTNPFIARNDRFRYIIERTQSLFLLHIKLFSLNWRLRYTHIIDENTVQRCEYVVHTFVKNDRHVDTIGRTGVVRTRDSWRYTSGYRIHT